VRHVGMSAFRQKRTLQCRSLSTQLQNDPLDRNRAP
jgi:hypothetical protein